MITTVDSPAGVPIEFCAVERIVKILHCDGDGGDRS